MSDYTKTTNFTAKDSLSSGDPLKLVKGSYFDTEFDNIATAIATKYDNSSVATQAQAEAESSNAVIMTPGRVANWADYNAGAVGDIQALTDPGADRMLYWDDSDGAVQWVTIGNGIEIDGATDTLQLPSTLSGAGLTLSSGVLAVGAGSGITVNADDVQLANASVSATTPISVASGVIGFDPSSLTAISAPASIAGGDIITLWDADASAPKAVEVVNAGYRSSTTASTTITPDYPTSKEGNLLYICTAATAVAFTIPANATDAYPIGTTFILYQQGAGQITVSVTTDTLRAPNGAKTAQQYSVIQVIKTASTEWVVCGDTTS